MVRGSHYGKKSGLSYGICIDFEGKDIQQRFDEHNAGKNVSMRSRRPFELIYYEAHTSKSDALRREGYFKTTKGKATLKQILKDALM